jgi:hypothetical protein
MDNTSQQPQNNTNSWSLDLGSLREKAKKQWDSIFSSEPTTQMNSFQSQGPPPPGTTGGRRTKRRNKMGGNTIATNAAPVHGLQVAKPTYWIKGGKRTRRRKGKKSRKSKTKCRRSRK